MTAPAEPEVAAPEAPEQDEDRSATGWSMRRRLARTYIGVGAVIALLAMLAIATLVATTVRMHHLVDHVSPAAVATGHLETAYVDQENGVRGYALAKTPNFLAPYQKGRASEKRSVRRLHELLRGDPQLLGQLRAVQQAAARWQRDVAEPAVARARAGGTVATGTLDQGQAAFNAIRGRLHILQGNLGRQRVQARNQLNRAVIVLDVVVGIALAGVVLIGIGLWQAQRRWVLVPVASVGAEVRRVAGGDLGHRISVAGPRELVELASDVEVMRQTIVALYQQAVRAQEEVSTSARLLSEQADELRRSNVELEQFAYVASHDLQEPLRKVASFCQLLERRYAGSLDERADQYIAFAVDGAKRMQRLINDLLSFSRVGRTTREFTEVDCNSALEQALSNLEAVIEDSGAEVTADRLPTVRGDQVLLTQVFQNLIGNAIKFHGDAPPRVHIGVSRGEEEYTFSCSDNGIGIEAEYADRVFVIFQRLHPKDVYEGTGIGLSMCKKIVEYHGGRIWIDTAEHAAAGGTTVRWTLPAAAEPAAMALVGAPVPSEGDTTAPGTLDGAADRETTQRETAHRDTTHRETTTEAEEATT